MSHLTYLLGAGVASGADVNFKELLSGKLHSHKWKAFWEALEAPHVGRLTLTMSNVILGFQVHYLDITSEADQVSPNRILFDYNSGHKIQYK